MVNSFGLGLSQAARLGYDLASQSAIDGGGFLPRDLAGLKAWYDTSSASYLTLDSTAVTQFLDRSGNGNDTVTQATSSKQPTWTANRINGLPTAVFDNGDTLGLPSGLFSIPNGNLTYFVALRQTSAAANDYILSFTEGGVSRGLLRYETDGVSALFRNRTAADNSVSVSGGANASPQILTAFRSGTTQSISINGGTAGTNAFGASEPGIDGGWIGSLDDTSMYLTGDVAEILIYNRTLTAEEIIQVERYLSKKWDIYVPGAMPGVFVSIWDTTKAGSANTHVVIPTVSTGTYNCTIDWGDGTTSYITAYNDPALDHTYSVAGVYIIKISGTFIGLRFANGGDRLKLMRILQWGSLRLGNDNGYFFGCANLVITATDILDLTGTNTMANGFRACSSIVTIPSINSWDWSTVTTISGMCLSNILQNQDFSFRTPSLVSVSGAFTGCTNNNGLLDIDTENVTIFSNLWSGNTNYNRPISLNTSSMQAAANLLLNAVNFDQDISHFNIANFNNGTNMLFGTAFSKPNYNKLLDITTGWPSQATVQSNVTFSAGTAHYDGANAIAGRAFLVTTKGWTITDGGTP